MTEGVESRRPNILYGYAAAILLTLLLRFGLVAATIYAQTSSNIPFTCLNSDQVLAFVRTIGVVVMMSIIAIVLFVLIFNTLGFVSTLAMRVGEFFNERIRFVIELILIYVLFLWNLDTNGIITNDNAGCAKISWNALFQSGPIFFQLMGWLLRLLSLPIPSS